MHEPGGSRRSMQTRTQATGRSETYTTHEGIAVTETWHIPGQSWPLGPCERQDPTTHTKSSTENIDVKKTWKNHHW